MKLYVVLERGGQYMTSVRAVRFATTVAEEPEIIITGLGLDRADWAEWSEMAYPAKVIIWNYLVRIAVNDLGMSGQAVIHFVNDNIVGMIAKEKIWTIWSVSTTVFLLAALGVWIYYTAKPEHEYIQPRIFPERYVLRDRTHIYAADLAHISDDGKCFYSICHDIGNCVCGEHHNISLEGRICDQWDTAHLWIQRRDRMLFHEVWRWLHVWVDYIGIATATGFGTFQLKKEFRDPYVQHLEWPFINREPTYCQQWDPEYHMP